MLGAEHPISLICSNSLAVCLMRQDKYSAAEALLRDALALSQEVLGEEHPDTAQARNNLANCIGAQGNYAEAERMHRQVLAQREKTLGREHPETLNSIHNLAACIDEQDRCGLQGGKVGGSWVALDVKAGFSCLPHCHCWHASPLFSPIPLNCTYAGTRRLRLSIRRLCS